MLIIEHFKYCNYHAGIYLYQKNHQQEEPLQVALTGYDL